jgi:hypothetical protein
MDLVEAVAAGEADEAPALGVAVAPPRGHN